MESGSNCQQLTFTHSLGLTEASGAEPILISAAGGGIVVHTILDLHAQRIPCITANEYDGLPSWHTYLIWPRHRRHHLKRAYHHRWRRLVRQFLKLVAKTP